MHSRSNRWFLLQGKRTTRGYSSVSGGLVRWVFFGFIQRKRGGDWGWKGHEGGLGIEGDWGNGVGDLPSRKGLLQMGQSMDGLRSLLGTRSSSEGCLAGVSHGKALEATLGQGARRFKIPGVRDWPSRFRSTKSTHRPKTPD